MAHRWGLIDRRHSSLRRRGCASVLTCVLVLAGCASDSNDDSSSDRSAGDSPSSSASNTSTDGAPTSDPLEMEAHDQLMIDLLAQSAALMHGLENEAILSAASMTSDDFDVEALASARLATDEAVAAHTEALSDLTITADQEGALHAVDNLNTRLNSLDTIRTVIDGDQASALNALLLLDDTSRVILALDEEVASVVSSDELADGIANYLELAQSKRAAALSAGLLAAVMGRQDPRFEDDRRAPCTADAECAELDAFVDALDDEAEHRSRFQDRATPDQNALLRNALTTPEVRDADDILQKVELAEDTSAPVTDAVPGLTLDDSLVASQDKLAALFGVQDRVLDDLRQS